MESSPQTQERHRASADDEAALCWLQHSCGHFEKGRLAGSVLSHNADELASLDREVDAPEGPALVVSNPTLQKPKRILLEASDPFLGSLVSNPDTLQRENAVPFWAHSFPRGLIRHGAPLLHGCW